MNRPQLPTDTKAVPVVNVNESVAPEFGAMTQITIPTTAIAPYVQLLQRRPSRHRARINIDSLGGGTSSISAGGGSVAPAGAGTVIATLVAPVTGEYTITAVQSVSGASAPDRNNMLLTFPGGTMILPVAVAGDSFATSAPIIIPLTAGQTVTVTQLAAAGTATSYYSTLTGVYTFGGAVVYLGTDPTQISNPNNPGGGQVLVAPRTIIWESQRPLYAVAIGGVVSACVQDESYDWSAGPAENIESDDETDAEDLDYEYTGS